MTRKNLSLIVFAALLIKPAASLQAGAWTLARGGWFLESYTSLFVSDEDFNDQKERTDKPNNGVYNEVSSKFSAEWGVLSDSFNLLLALPYKRVNYVDDYSDIDNAGFADLSFGGKYRLFEAPVVVSAALIGTAPTGYNGDAPLPLGTGSENIEARLYVSRALLPMQAVGDQPGYSRLLLNAEAGKDKYGIPYLAEINYFPVSWLYGKFLLSGFKDLPSQPDGQDYTKWNAILTLTSEGSNAILRTDTQKSLNLGIGYGRTFRGRNTGLGTDYTVSISFVF